MNFNINNFMKYSILFIIVTFSTFFIPNCSIMNQHGVYIGLLAATTFVLLDKYYTKLLSFPYILFLVTPDFALRFTI